MNVVTASIIDKGDRTSTNMLRIIAIALITLSHLDPFLPPSISAIATGGMIGNSLFFMLSALGICISLGNKPRPFVVWYSQRVLRLYPSYWLILTFVFAPYLIFAKGILARFNLQQVVQFYFMPVAPFWFLQALLVFYMAIYFICKSGSKKLFASVATMSVLIYCVWYMHGINHSVFWIETYPFKLLFYFMTMLFGIFISRRLNAMRFRGISDVVLAFGLFALIYLQKYFMSKGYFVNFQFLQHVFMIMLLYYLLKVFNAPFLTRWVMSSKKYSFAISYVSSLTLEIYLVQASIAPMFVSLALPVPFGAFAFIIGTIAISIIVKPLADRVHAVLAGA